MVRSSAWRVAPQFPPVVCHWDGDYLVYNPLSGHTHILDIESGEVLDAVMAGALDEAGICRRLGALLEVPEDDVLAVHVAEILAHLDQLGLIERID